ncbi:methyltransferase-like protein 7A [Rhinatrema bivittatum]|uniref:methyltransferase-like protein 7A n=1 Tax=Rhinatrema bivittatum TaxID=194408 RepID=UPI001126FD24|nr:methyltransferase-like protein 7A [Rhinatrema bivittatum]
MELLILFFQMGARLLILPVYLLDFLGLWIPLRKRLFPPIMEKISIMYNQKMHKYKKELFSNLEDFTGPSGEVTLLEIGCGTCSNFEFYPPKCKVICVDPNPNFQPYLSKSLADNRHVQCQRFLVASGEEMSQVATASVDVVVCTLVLCSVHNVDAVLRRSKNVLEPGGAYYFIEHVAADRASWDYYFQQVCSPNWQCLFDECDLTREIWKNLEKAKFSKLNLRHIEAPLMKLISPHIIGYAIK